MGIFTFEDGTEYDGPFEKDRMVDRNIAKLEADESPIKKGSKKEDNKA